MHPVSLPDSVLQSGQATESLKTCPSAVQYRWKAGHPVAKDALDGRLIAMSVVSCSRGKEQ